METKMTTKYTVTVTHEDVQAYYNSSVPVFFTSPSIVACCPVAQGLKRAFPNAGDVRVGQSSFWLGLKKLPLPAQVASFIESFDKHSDTWSKLLPLAFEVEV